MNSIRPFILAWILFVSIQSCDTNKPVDREAVLEEMSNRELRRIPETKIRQTAQLMGDSLAVQAEIALKSALQTAIKEGGVSHAIQFCNINALPIITEMVGESQLSIMRVSDRFRNPLDQPDSLESLILEAYQYNFDNNLSLETSLIEETREVLLYTKPISISTGLCLNCHGKVGQEVSEETYDTILSYYPADSAIDYKLNDFRGMWVIRIPRKEIIKSL